MQVLQAKYLYQKIYGVLFVENGRKGFVKILTALHPKNEGLE